MELYGNHPEEMHSPSYGRSSQHNRSLFSLFGSRKQALPTTLTDEQIVNITNMLHEENNVLDQLMNSNEAWALVLPQCGHSILWASPLFSDCLDLQYEEVFGASLRNISAFNTMLNQTKPTQAQQENMQKIEAFFQKLKNMKLQTLEHFVLELQVNELRNMSMQSSVQQSTNRESFGVFRNSSVGAVFRQHKALFSIHAYPIANKRIESLHIPIQTHSSSLSEKETASTTSSNSLVNTLRQFR
jgi:hypothetical protein